MVCSHRCIVSRVILTPQVSDDRVCYALHHFRSQGVSSKEIEMINLFHLKTGSTFSERS